MKFTKAQSTILEEIGTTNSVRNSAQRMRAIHPLLENNIVRRTVILDNNNCGIGYHWELV
jgi:hypothetical protein